MKKVNRITLALFMAFALILSGCGSSAKQDSAAETESYNYSSGFGMEMPAPEAPAAAPPMTEEVTMDYAEDAGVYESGSGAVKSQYGNHKIITNYYINMRTDEFDLHIQMLRDKAAALGGYVQYSSVEGTKPKTYHDSGRWASMSFRIPSDRAPEFVEFTEGTGEITSNSINTTDVTLEYYDSETRLEVLRTQLERLQSILVETDNLADIIALEQAIAEVTLEIEQLTTGLRKYDNLIEFTTVNVDINENRLAMAPADELTMGQRITEGFGENLHSLIITIEDVVVWFIINLPALLLIAALAALAIWVLRRVRIRNIIGSRKLKKEGKKNEEPKDKE